MVSEFLLDNSQNRIQKIEQVLKELDHVKKSPIESRVLKRFMAGCFIAAERIYSKEHPESRVIPRNLVSIREIIEGPKTRFVLERTAQPRQLPPQLVTQEQIGKTFKEQPFDIKKGINQKIPSFKQLNIPVRKQPQSAKTLYQQGTVLKRPDISAEAPKAPKAHTIEFNNFKVTADINGKYILIEPPITDNDIKLIEKLKEKSFFSSNKRLLEKEFLAKKIKKLSKKFKTDSSPIYVDKISYYIHRDLTGLGKVEALMHDQDIKKIITNSIDKKVFVYYKKKKYETNIIFKDKEEINNLIKKLASLAKKEVSEKEPLLEGSLPFGAKIQATYGSEYMQSKVVIIK